MKKFASIKILSTFALAITKSVVDGAIAQLVEQRTENPCVPGSNPGGTTKKRTPQEFSFFLYCHLVVDMPSFEFYKFYVQLYAIWRGVLYIFVNFVVWIVEMS